MNSDNDSVWRELSLGEAAKITMGQSPPSSTYNTEGFGLPFYQGKAEFGFRYPVVEKWCSEPQRIAEAGSVLVSVRAPVGDVNIADTRCCIGRGLAAVSGLADTSVTDYLYFYLQYHKAAIESKGTGSTFKAINKGTLHDFFVLLPPLPEQRRIAAVLNAIQEAIAAQEDVIAAARHFKRSLMQRLFTYGPGREPAETKATEIGEIPAHWEVVELGKLTTDGIKNGAFVKRDQFGEGVPFLNVADMYRSVEADLRFSERVTVDGSDISKYALEPGDLVFVRSSLKEEGVGQCCVVERLDETSIYDCHLMRVRVNRSQVLPRFLAYFFLTPLGKNSLIIRSKKTTMTTINQNGLAGALVPVPDFAAQEAIAESVQATDAKIAAEEDRKTALDALFKSMLHQLMTGQIRLLTDEGLPLPKN